MPYDALCSVLKDILCHYGDVHIFRLSTPNGEKVLLINQGGVSNKKY